jgi:hypothetical protein
VTSYLKENLSKNCAVLTGYSAGLRTVLSSRLSHRELRNSLRESHSFLNLPADTTMASSQSTQIQHPFLEIRSADEHRMIYVYLFKYNFLLHILLFLFFFSDNSVANKQQTAALLLSTIVTRTRRHIELTKTLTNLMGTLCYAREQSVHYFMQFFLHS